MHRLRHSLLFLGPLSLILLGQIASSEARSKKDDADTADVKADSKKDQAKKDEDSTDDVKVTVLDKTELRAEPTDIGKVVKKLRKKEKFDFLKRSPDGKWASVRKGKVEGWVLAEMLEGLPALPPPKPVAVVEVKPPPPPPPPPAPPKDECPNIEGNQEFVPIGLIKDASGKCIVEPHIDEPVVVEKKPETVKEPPKPLRDGFRGFFLSVGGGVAILSSGMNATTSSGLMPELFNYSIDALPGIALQMRVGYTLAFKRLRVGFDGGYRFGGGTSIVIQLPERDSLPTPGPGGGPVTSVLQTPRQELATTAHDVDVAVSIGGYFQLPKQLELSVRGRAGLQFLGFLPELNSTTSLPQELFYGPLIGIVAEMQSQYVQGFGVRLDVGAIPYALRTENPGLRDGDPKYSYGYYFGAAGTYRIVPGLELEFTYRLLGTSTSYQEGSIPERLVHDRDPEVQRLAKAGETLSSGSRSTSQHSLCVNLVFFRR